MEPIPPDPPVPPDPTPSPSPPSILKVSGKRHAPLDEGPAPRGKITVVEDREAGVASVSTVYLHPSYSIMGIREYSSSDPGPFIVHVIKAEEPNSGTTFRPIKFGQFLFQNKISDISRDGVKRLGRNKMSIVFKSADGANKFLSNSVLAKYKYEASIPNYNVTRMGVVRGIPVDWSMGDFVDSLEIPRDMSHVLKARRLNRKVRDADNGKTSWQPTQTVVLTFRGQVLPQKIYSYYNALSVEAYEFPTIQCLACCRFGHVKAQCRSKPRCFKCAQPHLGEECNVEKVSCLFCSGQHVATSKSCPEHARQKQIKVIMSRDGLSYHDAQELCRPSKSFSEVAKSVPSVPLPSTSATYSSVASSSVSHRKTVAHFSSPRAPLGKSYDKSTHQHITATPQSSLPNGCALQSRSSPTSNSQNVLLVQLLSIISGIISQNSQLPPHVAHLISQLTSSLSDNGSASHSSMEQ